MLCLVFENLSLSVIWNAPATLHPMITANSPASMTKVEQIEPVCLHLGSVYSSSVTG